MVSLFAGSRSIPSRFEGSAIRLFLRHTRIVLSHPVYVITVAGYTVYTGVVGLVAFWGPKCAKALFVLDNADLLMGIMSSVTGVVGTLLGGVLLDRLGEHILCDGHSSVSESKELYRWYREADFKDTLMSECLFDLQTAAFLRPLHLQASQRWGLFAASFLPSYWPHLLNGLLDLSP